MADTAKFEHFGNNRIFLNSLMISRKPSHSSESRIKQAIDDIKTNWWQGRSLKEIASHYRLDAGNLARAFRNREGMTVKRYLDDRRREYVKRRIADPKVLGYEIGAELGFTDDLAFYRWVKRAFGVSFVKLCALVRGDNLIRKHDKK